MRQIRVPKGLIVVSLALLGLAVQAPAAEDPKADLWSLLKGGGQVLFMRHGQTFPETVDPPGSKMGDCSTQRNLSDIGRQVARYVGDAVRAHGVPVGRVLASPWCRTMETGMLAFGKAEPWPDLESLGKAGTPERKLRERALRKLLGTRPKEGNTVLISHTYVITPLVGIAPVEAEFVVVTPQPGGNFRVAGRISPGDISSSR